MGTTKPTTSAALLSTGRWPSGPDLTRRCRRHPPRLRLLTHTVQVVHSLAKGRETDRADAPERQACPPGGEAGPLHGLAVGLRPRGRGPGGGVRGTGSGRAAGLPSARAPTGSSKWPGRSV
ncbi:Flagellar motor rotation protein MotB [Streptomyces misionensis JCM 4497]